MSRFGCVGSETHPEPAPRRVTTDNARRDSPLPICPQVRHQFHAQSLDILPPDNARLLYSRPSQDFCSLPNSLVFCLLAPLRNTRRRGDGRRTETAVTSVGTVPSSFTTVQSVWRVADGRADWGRQRSNHTDKAEALLCAPRHSSTRLPVGHRMPSSGQGLRAPDAEGVPVRRDTPVPSGKKGGLPGPYA